ncbi:MAG: AAA family ATPase [Bryobacteraceae bacterium]
MRIDRLELENFKKFSSLAIDFHPHFTLLAGENGSGKTSLLDALAVAAGIWLVEPPDSVLSGSRRNILRNEIRLAAQAKGDRVQFAEQRPVVVRATGRLGEGGPVVWSRQIRPTGSRTVNGDAKEALDFVRSVYSRDQAGEAVLCPVLAYYGAGRAWLPSNQRGEKPKANGVARRWAALYDCFNERIRFDELTKWFRREAIERGNRGGQWRPGFDAVRIAVLGSVPDADAIWFDTDRDQIVLSIGGEAQPFDNLSAGQKMMLAMVADLAIKAVTQNAFLVPSGSVSDGDPERVLRETPGLVLIDELDVHLHPKWQRRVAGDLKRIFPGIQFVCTSHSAQVIGELPAAEIRLLEDSAVTVPERSFGMDSNRVLEEIMGASTRNAEQSLLLRQLFAAIDQENFDGARVLLSSIESNVGPDEPEVTRARALMAFLESGQ